MSFFNKKSRNEAKNKLKNQINGLTPEERINKLLEKLTDAEIKLLLYAIHKKSLREEAFDYLNKEFKR